jgi:hypothetical protein
MKLHEPFCPECGEPAHGTVERLMGRAEFNGVPGPGVSVEYRGWTEVWWDEQRTAHQKEGEPEGSDNPPRVCCVNGHSWPTAIDWEAPER